MGKQIKILCILFCTVFVCTIFLACDNESSKSENVNQNSEILESAEETNNQNEIVNEQSEVTVNSLSESNTNTTITNPVWENYKTKSKYIFSLSLLNSECVIVKVTYDNFGGILSDVELDWIIVKNLKLISFDSNENGLLPEKLSGGEHLLIFERIENDKNSEIYVNGTVANKDQVDVRQSTVGGHLRIKPSANFNKTYLNNYKAYSYKFDRSNFKRYSSYSVFSSELYNVGKRTCIVANAQGIQYSATNPTISIRLRYNNLSGLLGHGEISWKLVNLKPFPHHDNPPLVVIPGTGSYIFELIDPNQKGYINYEVVIKDKNNFDQKKYIFNEIVVLSPCNK